MLPVSLHVNILQESVSGAFGDVFFSKQAVSSEKDAKKTRSDIEAIACSACVSFFSVLCRPLPFCSHRVETFCFFRYSTFDGKFNQYIGSVRLQSITIKEAIPPKAAVIPPMSQPYLVGTSCTAGRERI